MKQQQPMKEKDPLSLYLKQIMKYPLLSGEQELDLGEKIVKTDAALKKCVREAKHLQSCRNLQDTLEKLKNTMITSNLRLVVSIAKKYQYRGLSLLDLINEGNLGLIEAVDRFDYTKGCRFSTYGTWWIQQSIIKGIADKGKPIRIPIHTLKQLNKYHDFSSILTHQLGREPKTGEIADYMHLPVTRVETLESISQDTSSLDTTMDNDGTTPLHEILGNEKTASPFNDTFFNNICSILKESLSRLNFREMKIVELRYGLNGEGPLTLEDIGDQLGITRERVRQIQKKAISKLREFDQIKELQAVL